MLKNYTLLLCLFIFYGIAGNCQPNSHLRNIEKTIENENIEKAQKDLSLINYKTLSKPDKAYYFLVKAKMMELGTDDSGEAYTNYLISRNFYFSCDSINKAMNINLAIASLLFGDEKAKNNYQVYLDQYLEYAKKSKDPAKLALIYSKLAATKMVDKKLNESRTLFNKATKLNNGRDKALQENINHNLSVLFNEYLNEPDSALYYLKKNSVYLIQKNNAADLCDNYVTQAGSYYYMGNSKKALYYLQKADSLPISAYMLKRKQCIYEYMSLNYAELDDHANAYDFLIRSQQLTDSINAQKQSIAINEIQTKYQTREKELENKALKSNIKTNRILLYTFIGLLVASLTIGSLIVLNSRRKEKIAQQETLIEQQKLDKALKDYELSSIDLMLEGQEKERQRLANDLHDNLGSMLATLKLNFENLKLRKNELVEEQTKLYDKTDELLEEAYQKVRRIAHSKNAGVFANEGLIPAIKKLAEKISVPGKLKIDVIPFGFTERLDNTLEIAIFRIIQELSTNIIKHAKASEATIHLTNHDESINLIIEDNGIGFDPEKINSADGMGINSIKKKISQLNGSFTIDAMPGRGTTILIDLPL